MSSRTPEAATTPSTDWASGWTSYALRWGLPSLAVVAGLFLPVAWRVPVWCVSLMIMGVACLINARRCGRVHCRYTGPWYLFLTIPTLVLGFANAALNAWPWWILAALILLGSKVIWWITERRAGRYAQA